MTTPQLFAEDTKKIAKETPEHKDASKQALAQLPKENTKGVLALTEEQGKILDCTRKKIGKEAKGDLVELKVDCGENGCAILNSDGSINYDYTLNPRLADIGKKFDLDGETVFGNIDGANVKAILDENSENGRSKYTREQIGKQLDISGSTYKILFQNDLDVDLDSFQYLLEALREGGLTIDFLKEEFGISDAIVRNLLTYKHTKSHFKTKDLSDEVKTILGYIENENRTQENENRTQDIIRKERRLLQLELKRLEGQEGKIDNRNEKIQKVLDKLKEYKNII